MSYSQLLGKIVNNLADEESRDWFDARLKFSFTHNPFDFYPAVYRHSQSGFYGQDLNFLQRDEYKKKMIIIFGGGVLRKAHLRNFESHAV